MPPTISMSEKPENMEVSLHVFFFTYLQFAFISNCPPHKAASTFFGHSCLFPSGGERIWLFWQFLGQARVPIGIGYYFPPNHKPEHNWYSNFWLQRHETINHTNNFLKKFHLFPLSPDSSKLLLSPEMIIEPASFGPVY